MTSDAQLLAVRREQVRPATRSRTPPRPRRTRTTPTGRSSPNARSAATCAITPALSSAAPRPYSRPSRSTGSNGSLLHWRRVAGRLHVVVRVQQHRRRAGRRRPAADDRGLAAAARTIRTSGRPRRAAARRRPRRTAPRGEWSNPSNAMPGMRTRRSRSARTPGISRAIAARRSSSVKTRVDAGADRRSAESAPPAAGRGSCRRRRHRRRGRSRAAQSRAPPARPTQCQVGAPSPSLRSRPTSGSCDCVERLPVRVGGGLDVVADRGVAVVVAARVVAAEDRGRTRRSRSTRAARRPGPPAPGGCGRRSCRA